MAYDSQVPFNQLPQLPPIHEIETKAVLKATISARDALARFDSKAEALPNPTVLINSIPLLEAQASSEIENIVTTTDELFSAAVTEIGASPAAREALRYRTALSVGWESLRTRPLTARTALDVCQVIRGHSEGFRTGEAYIGNPVTGKRIYTPPKGETVIKEMLDNWSHFINTSTELDPLSQMAIAHYQFEAIHPFTDGNGRTGRIMNVLMLCQAGLISLPLLYLSRYIIETKDQYYRLLRGVTEKSRWEDWVLYVVQGVEQTAKRTGEVVAQIEDVQSVMVDHVRVAVGTANTDLVNVLMEQPYSRVRDVIEGCGVSRPTATKWLHRLVDNNVLRSVKVGREVLYINASLMGVLRR